ncbi:MAG TPA: hypothetical protein VNO52_16170 [Methylomirabilota bacterium]|nr:hypothetical protein [Methylomirabilota bacterium]
MSEAERKRNQSRAIITSACQMLRQMRQCDSPIARDLREPAADTYILLHDATRMYCEAVSEQWGEKQNARWSPALPEVLLSYPDRCEETLALVEQKDFREISYFQFATG